MTTTLLYVVKSSAYTCIWSSRICSICALLSLTPLYLIRYSVKRLLRFARV